MSYPQGPPGSPGYPPAQQPTTQFGAPTQQFGKAPEAGPGAADGASKLPMYLTAGVAALGLAVYLSSFGPLLNTGVDFFAPFLLDLGVVASLLAALVAGVALLPKQARANAVVAVLSVLAFLLLVAIVITAGDGVSIEWGLYLIVAFTAIQAIVAVAALLFDAGVITPPAPRPRYEQQQQHYGQYGGPGQYYGQSQAQQGQQGHGGAPQQGQQQRPGYPSQYGGGYPGGPSTGGFSAPGQAGGPPTPPTGFPTYGQPTAGSAPTTAVPSQPQPSQSPQSGPAPS